MNKNLINETLVEEAAPVVVEETVKKGVNWGKVGFVALIGTGLGYLGYRAIKRHRAKKAELQAKQMEAVNTTEVNKTEAN